MEGTRKAYIQILMENLSDRVQKPSGNHVGKQDHNIFIFWNNTE